MSGISVKELEAIKALRDRVKDVWDELDDFHQHDYTLLRFLVGCKWSQGYSIVKQSLVCGCSGSDLDFLLSLSACFTAAQWAAMADNGAFSSARDLNVDKAELMLRNNIKWRKDNKIDQIWSTELSEDIVSRFPFKYSGYDGEGRPIGCMPIGRYDYRYVFENKKTDEYMQFALRTGELGYEIFKHKSTPDNFVHQTIAILDYEGFALKHMMFSGAMQFMKDLMAVSEANYPEVLRATVVVNAPKTLDILFKIIKPFLTKAMLEKMQIYGSNADEWRQAVRKLAPADQIPSQYGGANTTCFNYKFDQGFDISPKIVTLPEENMKQVTLSAGQKLDVDIEVTSKGTRLSWNFKSDSYDVGFYVYFDAVAPENEIVACPRCDSHINVQKGTLVCEKAGKYILCFDNSYSKFRSKTLYYVTEILQPSPESLVQVLETPLK